MFYLFQANQLTEFWSRCVANANDWNESQRRAFASDFSTAVKQACLSEVLPLRSKMGLVIESNADAFDDGSSFLALDELCKWANGSAGLPINEFELAYLLGVNELDENSQPLRIEQLLKPDTGEALHFKENLNVLDLLAGRLDDRALQHVSPIVIYACKHNDEPVIQSTSSSVQDLYGVTATPVELVNAFGAASGLSLKTFNKWASSPGLKAANRLKGRSGKHKIEPRFCPHAVMLWLCNAARRSTGKLTCRQGYLLLENHFPRVYALHAHEDPRNESNT